MKKVRRKSQKRNISIPSVKYTGKGHCLDFIHPAEQIKNISIDRTPDNIGLPWAIELLFTLDVFMLITPVQFGVRVYVRNGYIYSTFKKYRHAMEYKKLLLSDSVLSDFTDLFAELEIS